MAYAKGGECKQAERDRDSDLEVGVFGLPYQAFVGVVRFTVILKYVVSCVHGSLGGAGPWDSRELE